MSSKYSFLILFLFSTYVGMGQGFVKTNGIQFERNGKAYHYIGANYWYGMHLGASEIGDRERLTKELDHLISIGVNNLRIMASCEGPDSSLYRISPALFHLPNTYNESIFEGLDFLLSEMAKRDMTAVMCLNNFWPWSGGMAQYVSTVNNTEIPYPSDEVGSWGQYMNFTAKFYKDKEANKLFRNFIKTLISRRNTVTGQLYKEDPTIMSWQLANEPRGMKKEKRLNKWIKRTAKYIKSLDPNHLVSVGSEGEVIRKTSGNHFKGNHKSKFIDYTTIHIWVQNWQFYDPMKPDSSYSEAVKFVNQYIKKHDNLSRKLNKPMVLEEFGISRDYNDHDPGAPVKWRDKYYKFIFEKLIEARKMGSSLVGCNFWAYSGYGLPPRPNEMWEVGDLFCGDPPHELQGWYSVYAKDQSTCDLIKYYNELINSFTP